MWNGGLFPFGHHGDDDSFGNAGLHGVGGAPAAHTGAFTRQFRAYPVSFIDRSEMENGDKIVLPPSALESLARLNITYPMLFQLESRDGLRTHCGVLEFVAEEGHINLPYWVMQNLLVGEGDMITVRNANLPKGTYVKFRPQSSDFLAIFNPKAVLEATLRGFSCLSKGHPIAINYNDKVYWIDILEVSPGDAISIIEADVNVDFAPPVDYVEPVPPSVGSGSSLKKLPSNSAPSAEGFAKPQRPTAGGSASTAGNEGAVGTLRADPSERLRQRLERFKKHRPVEGDDDDDDSDDDSDIEASKARPAAQPKERFPGGGQTLKAQRTGSGGLVFGGSSSMSAASSSTPGGRDERPSLSNAPKLPSNETKKVNEPFSGPGRTLR